MRTITLLAGLMLALALVTFLPDADARADACTNLTSTSCPGAVCYDNNGDRRLTTDDCLDRCRYQSDCCATTSFWCPETE